MAKTPEFIVLQDTREQNPLKFPHCEVERVTLPTGDYSAKVNGRSLHEIVAIERKSVADLLGSIGGGRERFERELARLSALRFKALVIEGDMAAVTAGTRFSTLTPRQTISPVLAWTFKYGLAPIFAPNRAWAARVVWLMLYHAVRYHLGDRDGE